MTIINSDGITMLKSSMISTFLTHPLDNMKTRRQVSKYKISLKHNIYSGVFYNLMTKPVFWGLTLGFKREITGNRYIDLLISANAASLATNPLFVLKTLREVDNKSRLSFDNMYKGYSVTVIRNFKMCFELLFIDDLVNNYSFSYGTSAFLVKTATNLLSYPLDTIATLRRTENISIVDILKTRNMYSGFGFYSVYSVINYMLMFTIYGILKNQK